MDNYDNVYNLVAHNDIFKELPRNIIDELIKCMKPLHFREGSNIIQKDTLGDWMCIIQSGRVKVHEGAQVIAYLGAGEVIGELSLLKAEVRSMSVTAVLDTHTYTITHNDFFRIAEKYPKVLKGIIRILVDRLRNQTTDTLQAYKIREEELTKLVNEKTIDLNKKNLELERTQKYKEQFLANMSHEIRTPMTAIIGLTNLVLQSSLNDTQRSYLTSVKKSSDNLLKIINEILDYSKIEAGRMELENMYFSIKEVAQQVVLTLKQKSIDKGIELYESLDDNIPEVVMGDALRLNQILINLAGNAIKFTDKGSVAIEIKSVSPNTVSFEIIDTGIGIPQNKINDIFKDFTQANTSDSRKFGGTGLGLTISKRMVQLMGGDITVKSELGRGSTFSFILEFQTGTKEALEKQNAPDSIDVEKLNGTNILLVDDNEINRLVCKDTLFSRAQVYITDAGNGKEAIEHFEKSNFDIILMDVQMPEMDGCEATQYIRSHFPKSKCNVPIIALTASVIRSDIDKCKEAGMNDYIPKPFQPEQLFSTILKYVKLREIHNSTSNKQHSDTSKITTALSVSNDFEIDGAPNLTYLKNFCNGDAARMYKYINMFLEANPPIIEKIEKALADNDFEEIANQVHGYKMKFIMMGMAEAKELGLALERACRSENPNNTSIQNKTNTLLSLINTLSNKLKIISSSLITN